MLENDSAKPHLDMNQSIVNLSINQSITQSWVKKSINMLTPTIIQTLDLFPGLKLDMGA